MSLVSGPGRGGSTSGAQELYTQKHVDYIKSLDTRRDELEYWLTEHLRLNGVYWGLTALHILGHPDALPRDKTIEFVLSCQSEDGGFGAAPRHDAHMLYTVSAVQILVTLDAVDELNKDGRGGKEKVASWIANLQDRSTAYIQSCANFDGGYGVRPGAESHAGQIFTCVGALAIVDRLDLVDTDRLGGWLSERQLENGGLNGRPEKKEDVCYSWWVMSALAMIGRLHWINGDKLAAFILRCQDPEHGGIADRPEDMVDVFHTVFGLTGLSLLKYPGLKEVDPVYCMPKEATDRALGRCV
ncbi:hypothetical protein H112_06890 [Trichophyton rubrum D6]|uniref:Geranylgeranyl transferase type-2 subunit beta n=2 Tax=Trichophyton rubrum TaxID=5551 RepID=F2SGB1_TRIRC|nr:uncharacterized protein TERG_02234 [Trichophyton rubrum CBS 118892]EZF12093.1 hypothetical protein H100_06913 [Trichophyton rubrum MR850]EZF38914.1 hypothetical protein H102_06875 [Trichophyton rubrum CBS 100081]EZF49513.1 hypothetical protein H103_06898 [Trichophyton rubrum CBS 288.86]EZF60139.1 hypothetical protein H104_06852 [Trichophyton rubrum CBS 289.86]EZF81514.1 hypothetical protein H110_06894 [Trichophyton rubrum MR1448]EZF92158.1 hypothetical protein H113_06947 [Trichophyton rubr